MAATVAVAVGSVVVKDTQMDLPPGFRFHPTDEELVTYYLVNKVATSTFKPHAIAEVDLNRCEPWDLPGKAQMGEKEWYFFSLRDRKYPTGMRTNRATDKGYWKATGKDRDVMKAGSLVGMKKTLVFYRGRAPRGEKTNWIMHEYRLERDGLGIVAAMRPHKASPKDEWVVCRIFQKNSGGKKSTNDATLDHYGEPTSPLNDQPDLDEDGMTNNSMSPYPNRVTSFGQLVPSPKTQKDVTLHEINSFTSTMGMNVRGYNPGYPSSSFPATNNTATLSPTTGPLSSDMSSTMASNYNDMSAAGLGNLSVPQGFSGQFGYLNQLLVQGQGQGTHLGMLRPCKQEPAYIPMNTLGEDEAHSGRTSSPGILLDHSISPTSQGWIPTANDGLQQHHQQHQQHLYGAELPPARLGLHNNRQHITPEHLAVVFPESSCVTEVVNDHHFRHITGSRYLADASGAVGVGDMPDWNFVAAAS